MARKNLEFIAATTGAIIYVASAIANITTDKNSSYHEPAPYTATIGCLMIIPAMQRLSKYFNSDKKH